jgi:hypothetical protein
MKNSRLEKIILVVMVIAIWAVLAIYAGAPGFFGRIYVHRYRVA